MLWVLPNSHERFTRHIIAWVAPSAEKQAIRLGHTRCTPVGQYLRWNGGRMRILERAFLLGVSGVVLGATMFAACGGDDQVFDDTGAAAAGVGGSIGGAGGLGGAGGAGGAGGGLALPECSENSVACPEECDAQLGCVQCLEDADCMGMAKTKCVGGSCEECAGGDDCGVMQACFPETHTCEDVCATDNDCNGDAPICDMTTGACVGCLSNTDCNNGDPLCAPLTQQCAECLSDGDCPIAKAHCDPKNKCRECLVDADCDGGEVCQDDECQPPCTSNADCLDVDAPLCDVPNQTCVECLGANDCADPADPACGENNKCVECVTGADCQDVGASVCDVDQQECVACVVNADCAAPGLGLCDNNDCVECIDNIDCTDLAAPNCVDSNCE